MKSFVVMLLLVSIGVAADPPAWPQFRGPGALGVVDSQTPPVKFGPTQNVKWKVACPPGFSSPVIAGEKIFLTAFDGGKLVTIAYSRTDGAELWRAEAPAKKIEPYHKTEGSPAASTPVTDGTHVVSYFGSAGLFCYDLAGKELWRFDMPMAETGFDFGTGTSPVLADGLVLLVRDLKTDSKLLALDVKTGSKVYEVKRDGFATAWSSPCLWPTATGTQVVLPGSGRMVGYDLKTGTEKWHVSGMPSACCTTPVIWDGNLVYAGWSPGDDFKMPSFDELIKDADTNKNGVLDKEEEDKSFIKGFFDNNDTNKDGKITREEWDANAAAMSKGRNSAFVLKPGGTGDVTKSHVVWKETKGLPYVPSPLVYKGQMYTISMRGLVTARDLKTGKDLFLDENVGLTGAYASPLAAGGHVYLFGLDGTVVVLRPGDFADVVYRVKLGDRVAATPAIVDNIMYVRTGKSLYAFAEAK